MQPYRETAILSTTGRELLRLRHSFLKNSIIALEADDLLTSETQMELPGLVDAWLQTSVELGDTLSGIADAVSPLRLFDLNPLLRGLPDVLKEQMSHFFAGRFARKDELVGLQSELLRQHFAFHAALGQLQQHCTEPLASKRDPAEPLTECWSKVIAQARMLSQSLEQAPTNVLMP